MGSFSPDRGYHLLQVKREPSETSPIPYIYGGAASPMYPGTSPGPPSPHSIPSPVPYPYGNFNLLRHNAGGCLIENKPAELNPFKSDVPYQSASGSKSTLEPTQLPYPNMFSSGSPLNDLNDSNLYVQQNLTTPNILTHKIGSTNMGTTDPRMNMPKMEHDLSRSQFPGTSGNTVLDMDSQQYSLDLNLAHLDSAELTRLAMMTDPNLSDNLSSNLTLEEKPGKSTMDCDEGNMSDSFSRVSLQELVDFSRMPQQ